MKTRKAVAARFKVTGTGKLLHNRPGRRHILTSKTGNRKRKLRKAIVLNDQAVVRKYKLMMLSV